MVLLFWLAVVAGTFHVTDELLFRDAKKDEAARQSYKQLAALHEVSLPLLVFPGLSRVLCHFVHPCLLVLASIVQSRFVIHFLRLAEEM